MKMKTTTGGNDGFNSYEPGVNDIAIDHARRVFVAGHGVPIGSDGKPMAIADAAKTFRLNTDEIATATANHQAHKTED